MYLKDFDLNKYNECLYLLSDLCVSNRDVVIDKALYNVKTFSVGTDNMLCLYYDTSLMNTKSLNRLQYSFSKEKNIYNIYTYFDDKSDKMLCRILLYIPKDKTLDYVFRIKYGMKYINKAALYNLMLFWGEYKFSYKQVNKKPRPLEKVVWVIFIRFVCTYNFVHIFFLYKDL